MRIRLIEQTRNASGAIDYDFVRDDIQPPLYASIEAGSSMPGITYVVPSGPFTEEQLALFKSMPRNNLDGAGFAKLEEQPAAYSFNGDPMYIRGEYPGGDLRVAANAARLVLAAEAEF